MRVQILIDSWRMVSNAGHQWKNKPHLKQATTNLELDRPQTFDTILSACMQLYHLYQKATKPSIIQIIKRNDLLVAISFNQPQSNET